MSAGELREREQAAGDRRFPASGRRWMESPEYYRELRHSLHELQGKLDVETRQGGGFDSMAGRDLRTRIRELTIQIDEWRASHPSLLR
jgi:hypothetical protein